MSPVFRKIHLWLSLPFGILFSISCLTGAILVFEKEITRAIRPETAQSEVRQDSAPTAVGDAAVPHDGSRHGEAAAEGHRGEAAAERRHGDVAEEHRGDGAEGHRGDGAEGRRGDGAAPREGRHGNASEGRHDRTDSVAVISLPGKDAGSAVQTASNRHGQRLPFFQTVLKLHRWLLDAPKSRGENSVGKIIVGISTLLMVFVLVSGIIIWIPKNSTQLKNRLKVSFRKGWPRFLHDSHVSLGIYVAIFLLIIAVTGLTWSFPWFRKGFVAVFEGIVGPDNMRGFIYSLHTGSWGGMVTKIIYFICALVGGFLPWTGYYLWFKKHKNKGSKRKS